MEVLEYMPCYICKLQTANWMKTRKLWSFEILSNAPVMLQSDALNRTREDKFATEFGRTPFIPGLNDISRVCKSGELFNEEMNPSSRVGDSAPVKLFIQSRTTCRRLKFPKSGTVPVNELLFNSRWVSFEALLRDAGIAPVSLFQYR